MHKNNKKNIIFIATIDFPNGLGNTMRIKMLAKAFKTNGYHCMILIPYAAGLTRNETNLKPEGEWEGIGFKYCSNSTTRPRNYLSLLYYKTFGILRVLRELWKQNKELPVNHIYIYGVHGTTIFEDFAYLMFARITKAKIIIDVNDSSIEGLMKRTDVSFFRYLLAWLKSIFIKMKGNYTLRNADVVVYVTQYLRKRIEKFIKHNAKLVHIPLLIDRNAIKNVKPKFNKREKVIIYAGHFKEFEGLDFLIESLKELILINTDFVCYLYGASKMNQYQVNRIQKMLSAANLSDYVVIKNIIPQYELFSILMSADVLVIPRRKSEITEAGFSQKFGDYLLSGVPVVSTEVGEITKMAKHNWNIYFTPEGDPKAFAKAIAHVFNNPKNSQQVGLNGRTFAIENFDYRKIARKLENVLL